MRTSTRKRFFFAHIAAIAAIGSAIQAAVPGEELGKIHFPTSGSSTARPHFLRGALLLHSFEYEDSRKAFQQAQKIDPNFAMAYWGEAMTHNHPIWNQQDRDEARSALRRLAPTLEGRLAKAPTKREKDYLRTLEVLYGEGDKVSRDHAYAEAMQQLAERYPDDLDAASLYALALLGTTQGERDFATYMRAAAVVEEVFAKNPEHPGAAHYLIHSYDDPIHAPLGLRAARVYARIAPAAPHALHMPSHIFVALGMWDDVSASNEDSWAAAEKQGRRNYHALWWLEYSYLQQGRYREAREQLAIIEGDDRKQSTRSTRSHLAHMRAHYLIETRQWDAASIGVDLSDLGPAPAASHLFADGLAAIKGNDRAGAEKMLAEITTVTQKAKEGAEKEAAEILGKELRAFILMAEGKSDEALKLMDEATAQEDAMPFEFGPPSPVKPSHELYGEILLDLNRPAEAGEQFELALARAPQRTLSLMGLVRAASRSGDVSLAKRTHEQLHQILHKADQPLPTLESFTGSDAASSAGGR